MKIIPLTPEERCRHLATHKFIITYADLTTAATTQTTQIFPYGTGTVPAGTIVRFAGLKLTTAFDFSDTDIDSLTVQVGDGGDTDRLLAATQIAADGTEVTDYVAATTTQPHAYASADGIDALFTVAGGASPLVSEATSGVLELFLFISNNNRLVAGR